MNGFDANTARVALVMGSKSDLGSLSGFFDILKKFGVPYCARVLSAHRTPQAAADFAENAQKNGIRVICAAAGKAAHLAGAMAAHSLLPVIGIPVKSSTLDGLDALLATVQILALSDGALAQKLKDYRAEMTRAVLAADSALQEEI